MAVPHWDVVVVKALHHVSGKSLGEGASCNYCNNLATLKHYTPGHDHSDISGTQDYDFLSDHLAFDIDIPLCSTCCEYAGGSVPCNSDTASGPLTATHGQYNSLCLEFKDTLLAVHHSKSLVLSNIQNDCIKEVLDLGLLGHIDKALCILRTCKLLFEDMESESVMDALLQDSTRLNIAFYNGNALDSVVICFQGSCHSGRTATYYYKIKIHLHPPTLSFL